MRYKTLGALVGAITLLASLSACGDASKSESSASGENNQSTNSVSYPLEVNSCGRKVTIEKEPTKVMSIGVASGIFAAKVAKKGQFVLRSGELGEKNPLADEYGAELWDEASPSTEGIIEKGVDLVIGDLYGKADPDKLAAAGIQMYIPSVLCQHAKEENPDLVKGDVSPVKLTDVENDIQELGKILNNPDASEKAVHEFDSKYKEAKNTIKDSGKSAAFLFYFSEQYPVMSVGEGGIEGAIMRELGLKNIFSDHKEAYLEEVSWEAVLQANPDVIIIKYGRTGSTFEQDKARLLKEPGADTLTAVKNDNIIGIANRETWPSPEIATGMLELAKNINKIK
ncbi:ABC transporter substrate-binding protein [Mobiluncus curtisii]|nr:ABC transporter substrate-binding protein [Mobiluncus curtisii]STY76592.1 corrinoid ABC transporter substrate-binding protein [Mobiluncus curtisii subsp. curtisii]